MNRSLLALFIVLSGCHPAAEEPTSTRDGALVDPGEPPADVATIAGLLRARHAEDLPSAEDLAKYPSAEASLRHLAVAGETMVMRTRALTLLRHFDSDETGMLLVDVVRDVEAHPALRAAAVTGLGGQRLDARAEQLEVVVAALRDADPRVGLAAVEVLDGSDAGRRELRRALEREDLPERVRGAIEGR